MTLVVGQRRRVPGHDLPGVVVAISGKVAFVCLEDELRFPGDRLEWDAREFLFWRETGEFIREGVGRRTFRIPRAQTEAYRNRPDQIRVIIEERDER